MPMTTQNSSKSAPPPVYTKKEMCPTELTASLCDPSLIYGFSGSRSCLLYLAVEMNSRYEEEGIGGREGKRGISGGKEHCARES